jgi:hypothetical protein
LKSYGPDGAYKEYAGHDATLALAKHKTDEEWLDRFVKMDEAWIKDAKVCVCLLYSRAVSS